MIILWIDWATKKLEMLAIFVGCSAHWPLKNKVWSMTESSFLSWSSGVLYPDGLKRIHWKSTDGFHLERWFSFGKVSQTDVRVAQLCKPDQWLPGRSRMGSKDIQGLTGTYTGTYTNSWIERPRPSKQTQKNGFILFQSQLVRNMLCVLNRLGHNIMYLYIYIHICTYKYIYIQLYILNNMHNQVCVYKLHINSIYVYVCICTRIRDCTHVCRRCSQGCWSARWRYAKCHSSTCAIVFQRVRFRALVLCTLRLSKMLGNYFKLRLH